MHCVTIRSIELIKMIEILGYGNMLVPALERKRKRAIFIYENFAQQGSAVRATSDYRASLEKLRESELI